MHIHSLPLLDDHAATLEVAHVTQHNTLVLKLFRRESRHQRPLPVAACGGSTTDKVVDVADGLRGVEARLHTATIAEADLEGDWLTIAIHRLANHRTSIHTIVERSDQSKQLSDISNPNVSDLEIHISRL